MKLIDAPIGIFRFNGELVLKTEYCSENKLSGKYIPDCYIVRTGEYFFGGAKTANELNNLDVEPVDFAELLPTVTDTISRAKAIEALYSQREKSGNIWVRTAITNCVEAIEQLPPAQPERGAIEQIKWERDVAIEQLKKLGYGLGEKIRAEKDCISRQAAIDALCAVCGKACDKSKFVYNAPQDEQVILCPEHYCLCTLPSAEPQIIRCKDCKHYKYGMCMKICANKSTNGFCDWGERETE